MREQSSGKRIGPLARTIRLLLSTILTIAISVLCAEIVFGLFFSIERHTFFWTRASAPSSAGERTAPTANLAQEIPTVLSPYFGAVWHPGFSLEPSWTPDYLRQYIGLDHAPDYVHWRANNYGFLQDRDYPVTDLAPNDFVVGIFGASTAEALALDGRADLAAMLAMNPALAGRRVVVLDFATAVAKAPQQALVLTYFITMGQRFDLIINMDGVGNAYSSWQNVVQYQVDPAMPDARLLIGLQNLMASKEVARTAAATRAESATLDDAMARTRSALRYYWLLFAHDRLDADDAAREEANAAVVPGRFYVEILNAAKTADYRTELGRVADLWVHNSLTMATLAHSIGAAYLHILEPNQYVGAKPFSDVERQRFAQKPDVPMSEIVPPTYKALRDASPRLTEAGIDFLDATGAYDRHPETIYIDWCCHENAAGIHALVTETLGPALRAIKLGLAATPPR